MTVSTRESTIQDKDRRPGWYWVVNRAPFDYPDYLAQLYWDIEKQSWVEPTGFERASRHVHPVKRIEPIPEHDVRYVQRLGLDNEKGQERISDLLRSFMGGKIDVPSLHIIEQHLAMHFYRELSFDPHGPAMVMGQIESNLIAFAPDGTNNVQISFTKALNEAFDIKPTSLAW